MEKYYLGMSGCPIHGNTVQLSNDISMPALGLDDDSMKRIAAEITENTLIHKELFDYTHKNLISGIDNVYGNLKYDDPQFSLVQQMKRNLAHFAGFKSYHQTHHIRQAKPEQLPAINASYNVNWMRTEYVHTVRSAGGAKNWQRYEADKDLYPFLEYMPSTAAEPRNEHKRLYGVIKPVDDPFWDTWMPPNDWGCRCSVKQVRNNADAVEPPEDIKLPPKAMRNNPGKTGIIITDQHPMIGRVSGQQKPSLLKEIQRFEFVDNRNKTIEYVTKNYLGKSLLLKGNKIKFTKSGLMKAINQPHKNYLIKNTIIIQLNNLFKNASFVKSIDPLPKRKATIRKTHIYSANIAGEKNYILIWEYKKTHEMVFHTIVDKLRK
jgi:hypothetical protein